MAKYCSNCGAEIQEGFAFCEKCGNPVDGPVQAPAQPAGPAPAAQPAYNAQYAQPVGVAPKRNGLALAGFILAICNATICCGSLSLIALIFCILGMTKAKEYNGDRKGLATAGLIITILMMIISVIATIVMIATGSFETTTSWGY